MKQKYFYDENFFSNISEPAFYWVGFIAADGSISAKTDFTLSLKQSDRFHLEKFINHINSNAVIKILPPKEKIINTIETKTSGTAIVRFRAKKWTNDFLNFNIMPNKTKIYDIPNWLIDHYLFKHFIRGYFDGDGWFSIKNYKNKSRLTWGLCGNLSVLLKIRNHLTYYCQTNSIPTIYKQKNIFKMEFQNQNDIKKIVDYLYINSTIYLDRKYEIAKLANKYDNDTIILNLDKDKLFEALNRLKSYKLVAEEFNCAKSTIAKYVKKYKN